MIWMTTFYFFQRSGGNLPDRKLNKGLEKQIKGGKYEEST